jgi:hypothetical protein
MIADACQPTGRTLPGWGDPNSDYAGIRFRTAILNTITVLEKAVPPSYFADQQQQKKGFNVANPASKSVRVSLLAKYIPLTQGDTPVLPKSLMPLLLLYENHLEDARWKAHEPTQKQYEDCLRIVAVLLDILGKRLPLKTQQRNDRNSGHANSRAFDKG